MRKCLIFVLPLSCISEPQILNGKVEESLTCLSLSLRICLFRRVLTPFFAAVKMQRSNHLRDRTAKITDINANYTEEEHQEQHQHQRTD